MLCKMMCFIGAQINEKLAGLHVLNAKQSILKEIIFFALVSTVSVFIVWEDIFYICNSLKI